MPIAIASAATISRTTQPTRAPRAARLLRRCGGGRLRLREPLLEIGDRNRAGNALAVLEDHRRRAVDALVAAEGEDLVDRGSALGFAAGEGFAQHRIEPRLA